ncbi:hypothetical protein AB0M29_17495 [Streptomyces sp. NPDC051976]|uniref:HoxN/HupN/NixA family nickel/cobalt transporter n=1 Tax=Streptomyces sp. NPDC051976 TaxID=3154947 RepID=UPI003426CB09
MTPTTPRRARRAAALLIGVPALLWLAGPAASAHPLGNFTVNRYDGLTLHPDRVDDLAVVDTAEIPTLQAEPAIDTDHDGTLSAREAAAHAHKACAVLDAAIDATVQPGHHAAQRPSVLRFRVSASSFRLVHGQAGLNTSRLECQLTASADITTGDVVALSSGVDDSRIGWHEITARGDGVHIGSSDVPANSVSNELRHYPADLLANPLDTRHARVVLGAGPGAALATAPGTGWSSAWYAALDRHLSALTDKDTLTLPVGLLAITMALVLGAGHAALPGHGKTIMAAYLAGRQGRTRDALTVAGTVTLTHTASVLVLGIALSASSALAGEDVLAWLGTVSGLVITAAGLWLLPAALRTFRHQRPTTSTTHPHHHGAEHHGPAPDHRHAPAQPALPLVTSMAAATADNTPPATVAVSPHTALPHQPQDHTHGDHHAAHHGHPHDDHHGHHGHHYSPGHEHDTDSRHTHSHGLFGHHHTHTSGPAKGGLIGIGIAGGLVPSPSALVVLLGSIALGRTAFGILLVGCYGLGMATALAAAGLLLLKLRDRLPTLSGGKWHHLATWVARITPLGTALLILAVGVGTALRAMPL